jgi:hypothetical protein
MGYLRSVIEITANGISYFIYYQPSLTFSVSWVAFYRSKGFTRRTEAMLADGRGRGLLSTGELYHQRVRPE